MVHVNQICIDMLEELKKIKNCKFATNFTFNIFFN